MKVEKVRVNIYDPTTGEIVLYRPINVDASYSAALKRIRRSISKMVNPDKATKLFDLELTTRDMFETIPGTSYKALCDRMWERVFNCREVEK